MFRRVLVHAETWHSHSLFWRTFSTLPFHTSFSHFLSFINLLINYRYEADSGAAHAGRGDICGEVTEEVSGTRCGLCLGLTAGRGARAGAVCVWHAAVQVRRERRVGRGSVVCVWHAAVQVRKNREVWREVGG